MVVRTLVRACAVFVVVLVMASQAAAQNGVPVSGRLLNSLNATPLGGATVQIEVHLQFDRRHTRGNLHLGAPRREALREHGDVIRPGWDVVEREHSVRARHRLATKFVDLYRGAPKRSGIQ